MDPTESMGSTTGNDSADHTAVDELIDAHLVYSTSTAVVAIRTAVLSLILLASFAGNSLLLATLIYSRSLRRRSANRLLSNACVANLFDLLCNCTVAIGASVSSAAASPPTSTMVRRQAPWSQTACRFTAFTLLFGDHLPLFCLLCLACDRLWALANWDSHRRRCRVATVSLAGAAVWLAAFAISLPAWTESAGVPVAFYAGRLTCSPAPGTPLAYAAILLGLGFLAPLIATAAILVASLRLVATSGGPAEALASSASTAQLALASASGVSAASSTAMAGALAAATGGGGGVDCRTTSGGPTEPPAVHHRHHRLGRQNSVTVSASSGPLAALAGWLTAAWLLLVGPYASLISADRIKVAASGAVSAAAGGGNALLADSTIAEALETAALALRLAYGPALPAVVLALRPEVRRKLCAMLNAALRNGGSGASGGGGSSAGVCNGSKTATSANSQLEQPSKLARNQQQQQQQLHKQFQSANGSASAAAASSSTTTAAPSAMSSQARRARLLTLAPVLFATKDGLHQQLANSPQPVRCDVVAEAAADPNAAKHQQRKAVRFARPLDPLPPPLQQQQHQQQQQQPQNRRRHRSRRERRAAAEAAAAAAAAAKQAPAVPPPPPPSMLRRPQTAVATSGRPAGAAAAADSLGSESAASTSRRPRSAVRRLRQNSVEPPPPAGSQPQTQFQAGTTSNA